MTWPPSCHAASPWSTPTPRTSPSSTKETGWSDDDQGESKRSSAGSRGQTCSGAPHPKALQSTPRHQRVLPTLDKSENTVVAHFSSVELFFISSYLCLVVVCVWRGISTSSLSVSLVSPREVLAFSLFCTTTRPCFCWISCDEIPHVYYCYTWKELFWRTTFCFLFVSRCEKKHEENRKGKNEGMLHLSLVLQQHLPPGGWTWHWTNAVLF